MPEFLHNNCPKIFPEFWGAHVPPTPSPAPMASVWGRSSDDHRVLYSVNDVASCEASRCVT